MNFPYLKAARVKLQERKNACLQASYTAASTYMVHLLRFIKENQVLRSTTNELMSLAQEKYPTAESLVTGKRWKLPEAENDCAAFYLRCLEIAATSPTGIQEFHHVYRRVTSTLQEEYELFLKQIVVPLCSYLEEKVDDGDLLLYMLSRYQRESAWFETNRLAELLASVESNKVEEVFDQHLRSWLFREGIDYPFSTPKSPSGRPDVVVWHGEEPLPIEVKVCDDKHRDARHVSQGIWQAHRYAIDYGKAFGYLVVFNTSDRPLEFENNISNEGPPCVVVAGIHVFAIVVNVTSGRPSASKEKPVAARIVKAPVLVSCCSATQSDPVEVSDS